MTETAQGKIGTPDPSGLGYDFTDIDAIIKERTARAAQERAFDFDGKIVKEGPGPLTDQQRSNGDIVTINETGKGNSADYLTARIARDHPDILNRMKAGESVAV